jgi:hypothetical protein
VSATVNRGSGARGMHTRAFATASRTPALGEAPEAPSARPDLLGPAFPPVARLAIDFFTVPIVNFRILICFLVLRLIFDPLRASGPASPRRVGQPSDQRSGRKACRRIRIAGWSSHPSAHRWSGCGGGFGSR